MDKKKVIIAIILFVFLGLTVFTFAQTPEDEGEGNSLADNGANVVTTTKVASTEEDNDSESNNSRANTTTTRTTTAARNDETTTTRTTTVVTTTKVVQTNNEDNQPSSDDNQGIGNGGADETVPTIIINGETLKEDVDEMTFATINEFVVNDNNDTVIKVNDEEIEIDDLLALLSVDGEYEIEVSDGVNTRKIRLLIDTTAPKATRVEILNDTENENTSYANLGDTLRVLVWFDEELAVLPNLTIVGDRTVTMRKSGALTNEDNNEYVYYYDYIIRKELAQGEIEFLISGYEDKLENKGDDITETLNASYPRVIYDSVAPTFEFENTSGSMVASRTVKLIVSETILAPEGWTEVDGSNGKEWTKTFTSNTKIKKFVVTDLAGNVSDSKMLDVKNVDSSVPTGNIKYSTETPTNENVTVTLTTSTDCLTPTGWTKVNWRKFTKVYTDNGFETIHLTSRTGIEGNEDIPVEVANIDRDFSSLTYHVYGNQVRIKADEKFSLNVNGWTKKNDGKEWRKTLNSGKNYEITATDEAGNSTTIVIDRILPTVTYSIHGKQVRIKADETVTLNVRGWTDYKKDGTEWRKTLEAGKKYEITATDQVGNSTTIVIEMKNDSKITLVAPSDLEYDGNVKEVIGTLIKGETSESIDVTYYQGETKLDGAPVNAGTYTAVAEFVGDDYYYESSAILEFTITQAQVTVSLDLPENMTYDGNAKEVKFKFTNASGNEVTGILNVPSVLAKPNNGFGWYNEFVNAGTYSVWTGFETIETDNYSLINLTNGSYYGSFTIAKGSANIELVAPDNLVWDGNKKTYTVKESAISDEVTLTYYEVTESGETVLDGAPVNVGNYKVVAEFAGNNNYLATETVSETFSITALTVTAYLDVPENMTYDGTVKDVKVVFKDQDGNVVNNLKYDLMMRYTFENKTYWVTEVKEVGSYEVAVWLDTESTANNVITTNPSAVIGVVEVTEPIVEDVYSHVLVALDNNYISYDEIISDEKTEVIYTYRYDGNSKGFKLNLFHNGNDVTNETEILMAYMPQQGGWLFTAPSEVGTYKIYPWGMPSEYNSNFSASIVILPAE